MAGPNSLYPSFVQIHYHSQWGPHIQTIPTKQWQSGGLFGAYGGYTSWSSTLADADVMIGALVDKFAAVSQSGVHWDYAVVYNYPGPLPSDPQPVRVIPLTQVGALTADPLALAIQNVYTLYDLGFNTVKLVLLDADASMGLTKQTYGDLDAAHQAIITEFADSAVAWSSRAGLQPGGLRSAISKPNDKLRREYRIV